MTIRLALLALAAACSGCATTWALSQATGTARVWDEGVHEEVVPRAGIDERLTITLPLAPQYPTAEPGTPPPATMPAPLPFALGCSADQRGRDDVYHAAFRYGSTWKTGTAIMALAEGLAASGILLLGDRNQPGTVLSGGFFALDAVGAAALFFAPREEIYRRDERAVATHVRSDCPGGLILEIAGDSFPIDAAGRVGELGEAALADWMQAPAGAVRVVFAGEVRDLALGPSEQCTWQRAHQPLQARACHGGALIATVTIAVRPGTLTAAAQQ